VDVTGDLVWGLLFSLLVDAWVLADDGCRWRGEQHWYGSCYGVTMHCVSLVAVAALRDVLRDVVRWCRRRMPSARARPRQQTTRAWHGWCVAAAVNCDGALSQRM
jgi:hypothetical protein